MSEPMTINWVRCPVCNEPDMRKETDSEGNSIIDCTNLVCGSNGGTNFATTAPVEVDEKAVLRKFLADFPEYVFDKGAGVFRWKLSSREAEPANQLFRGYVMAAKRHAASVAAQQPIDMILHCPACGLQHVDYPDMVDTWTNPPHKSHLCRKTDGGCGHIWRPADVATNGISAIKTKGKADSSLVQPVAAQQPDPRDERLVSLRRELGKRGFAEAQKEDAALIAMAANVAAEDGIVIAHRGQKISELKARIAALEAQLAQQSKDGELADIPQGVYYCRHADNFYSCDTKGGQGQAFYATWRSRRLDFPQDANEARRARAQQPQASAPLQDDPTDDLLKAIGHYSVVAVAKAWPHIDARMRRNYGDLMEQPKASERGEVVPDFWAAVDYSDRAPDIGFSLSTDDANGGLAARQEVNDWINERNPKLRLRAIYLHPQQAPAVPDADDMRERLSEISRAVFDGDDRHAQAMIGEAIRLLLNAPKPEAQA